MLDEYKRLCYNVDMNTYPIFSTFQEYVDFLRSATAYTDLDLQPPTLSESAISALQTAESKWKPRHGFSNRSVFKKLAKTLKNELALPWDITVFSKKMPACAYYVHQNKPFPIPGIYLHKSLTARQFASCISLFLHELCHYFLSSSENASVIFQTTAAMKSTLPPHCGAEELNPFFALYPTEFYAVCMQHRLMRSLISHLSKETGEVFEKQIARETEEMNLLRSAYLAVLATVQ